MQFSKWRPAKNNRKKGTSILARSSNLPPQTTKARSLQEHIQCEPKHIATVGWSIDVERRGKWRTRHSGRGTGVLVARIRHTRSNDEGATAAKYLGPRATETHHRVEVTTNSQAWRCTDGECKGERLWRVWSQDSRYIQEKGASRPQHRGTVTRAVRE
jgi:hypothetical protein